MVKLSRPLTLLLLVGVLLLLYVGLRNRASSGRFTADPPAMVKAIQQLSELVTVQYLVQKIVGVEQPKIPIGSEKLLLIVEARVIGGIDLKQIGPQDIQKNSAGVWA